ncbi:MAG: ABC transporter permease [Rheinheimera sp.]|nr:ABC transporter permease [Rheinheimera sp.]
MWQVYFKELLELSRDRKTLMFVIALPIIVFPLLFGVMGLVMANVSRQAEAEEHRYVIVNPELAPEFANALFYHKNFKKVESDLKDLEALKQAIRDDKFDVAIIIPADFSQDPAQLHQHQWQLVYNSSSQLDMVGNYFNELFKTYTKKLQQDRLASLGVVAEQVPAVLEPVKVKKVNTAESREDIGEKIGGFIAYILSAVMFDGRFLSSH